MRAGASEDQVDVSVKVTDEKPIRGVSVTLDNTGTGETGYFRSGIGFQHTNRSTATTSSRRSTSPRPTKIDDVTIFGVGLSHSVLPVEQHARPHRRLFGRRLRQRCRDCSTWPAAARSAPRAGTTYLPKWGELEHKVSLGLDYRAFRNNVSLGGRRGHWHPRTGYHDPPGEPHLLGAAALCRRPSCRSTRSVSRNIPFGTDGDSGGVPARDGAATCGADPRLYTILRYGGDLRAGVAGDWQVRVAFNAQYTSDLLVPGEQFGLGGPDSVRGYLVRELSNDRGYQRAVRALYAGPGAQGRAAGCQPAAVPRLLRLWGRSTATTLCRANRAHDSDRQRRYRRAAQLRQEHQPAPGCSRRSCSRPPTARPAASASTAPSRNLLASPAGAGGRPLPDAALLRVSRQLISSV